MNFKIYWMTTDTKGNLQEVKYQIIYKNGNECEKVAYKDVNISRGKKYIKLSKIGRRFAHTDSYWCRQKKLYIIKGKENKYKVNK